MLRPLILAAVSLVAAAALAIPVLAASSAAQTVRVTERSYRISLSAKPRAGLVKFVVRNSSDDGHDFWLKGGGKKWKTRLLGVGGSTSLTARLTKGVRYTYWCAVGDHAEEGMKGSFVAR